ncbi:DUF397 domain-containing protein [Actinomadura graeca]|uniref:DUF397 domain-containing protein n=1 Tax=Actinomadura graeca TaxID=2750812 RepID=A0ABX8QYW0_9ACTN|nr:DUF397 domain-containing protein [Actinomadura graeca]QXJ23985.1 DUF397 domain-containing protein [Actinomadura graeca]
MDRGKAAWRRASRSKEDGSNCVELARVTHLIAVRDSQDPEGPKLFIGHHDFRQFAEIIRSL